MPLTDKRVGSIETRAALQFVRALSRIVLCLSAFVAVRFFDRAGVDRKFIKPLAAMAWLAGYAGYHRLQTMFQ